MLTRTDRVSDYFSWDFPIWLALLQGNRIRAELGRAGELASETFGAPTIVEPFESRCPRVYCNSGSTMILGQLGIRDSLFWSLQALYSYCVELTVQLRRLTWMSSFGTNSRIP
jgi:hypothetical protein